ncbi:MAG: SCO family protein [Rubrivivax sp.]|nr:SCO family protein [Rubrivivax sp.]
MLVAACGAPSGAAAADPSVVQRADETGVPRLDEREALRAGEAVVGTQPPDFAFTSRHGQPVRLSDYRGKPLLVSFIYTGCFQVCPTQTRALNEAVQGLDKLLGPDRYHVVSIGFNQPFDSPEQMRAYAAQHRIQARNWEFLSPPAAAVAPLTRAFGFSYLATPAGFDHVLGVTVLDAEGRVRAQVWGDALRADQLGGPLRQLLLGAPVVGTDAGTTIAALVDRVRVLCTVYDPNTGTYRYDVKLVAELIGGSLFFLTAFAYLCVEWRRQRRSRLAVPPAVCLPLHPAPTPEPAPVSGRTA